MKKKSSLKSQWRKGTQKEEETWKSSKETLSGTLHPISDLQPVNALFDSDFTF